MKKSLLLFLTLAIAFTSTSPSLASEKGWRYWGYYQAHTSQWVMANTGPSVPLKDGSVEGWIFTFSSKSIASSPPSVAPNFASICKGVKRDKDLMRIALVIDYGSSLIAPFGEKPKTATTECVEIFPGATGLDVLQQNVDIRQSSQGFICAINKYPAKECSAQVVAPIKLFKK